MSAVALAAGARGGRVEPLSAWKAPNDTTKAAAQTASTRVLDRRRVTAA